MPGEILDRTIDAPSSAARWYRTVSLEEPRALLISDTLLAPLRARYSTIRDLTWLRRNLGRRLSV